MALPTQKRSKSRKKVKQYKNRLKAKFYLFVLSVKNLFFLTMLVRIVASIQIEKFFNLGRIRKKEKKK